MQPHGAARRADQAWRGVGVGAFLAAEAVGFRGSGRHLAAADLDDEDSPRGRLVRAAGFHRLDGWLAIRSCVSSHNDGHRRHLALQHAQVARLTEPVRGVHAEPPF